MTSPIFDFDNIHDFLNFHIQNQKALRKNFSLRSWSQELGYKNPSLLSDVIRGKRNIPDSLSVRLIEHLRLTDSEASYFGLLIKISRLKDDSDRIKSTVQARAMRKVLQKEVIKKSAIVRDWHYTALMELVRLKDFQENPNWISTRLDHKLSPPKITLSLERLLQAGLLQRNKKGKLETTDHYKYFGNDIPSEAIRQHHRAYVEKALEALDERPIQDRYFLGTTLSIKTKDVEKLKELTQKFHADIYSLSSDDGDTVYRLNTQVFDVLS